jgi:hypothetical protein
MDYLLSLNPIFSINPLGQLTSAARGALRGGASGFLGCPLLLSEIMEGT